METKEKKQVVNAIAKATNILVTVGVDPTVDELSSLLGLTLILSKLDKHATAVFSGNIPPAIAFLEPDKTFEDTVDGLRDFIIALNKDKADHLRYKLEGDVVKIFITPYKNTIIRDTDLEFSQGDFNVDLILALGVENKTDLDSAVASHGRILHDATTITLSAGAATSQLGEIDWHAGNASSLSEMVVSLSRDLGDDLLDEHVATALLTGIVSNTDRFSNNLTTSDVMKTAATLMGFGANQQLIATRLEEAHEAPAPVRRDEPVEESPAAPQAAEDEGDGSMQITHEEGEPNPDDHEAPHGDADIDQEPAPVLSGPSLSDVERDKDEVLQEELDKVIPQSNVDLSDLDHEAPTRSDAAPTEPAEQATDTDEHIPQRQFIAKATNYEDMEQPSMGGTLNATTEQAEEDSRSAIEDDRNRVILSHDTPAAEEEPVLPPTPAQNQEPAPEPQATPIAIPTPRAPIPVPVPDSFNDEPAQIAPTRGEQKVANDSVQPSVEEALATLGYPAGSHPTLADLDQKTGHSHSEDPSEDRSNDDTHAELPATAPQSSTPPRPAAHPALEVDDARAAVATALDGVFDAGNNPAANIGSQPLADVHPEPQPVFAPEPAPAAATVSVATPVAPQPAISSAIDLPPLPPLPPLPGQAGGLPPLPPLPELTPEPAPMAQPAPAPTAAPTTNDWQAHTVEPPAPNDPSQFHIPGQK